MTTENITRQAAPLSHVYWREQRPRTLVMCCSDGRLQAAIDDFLHEHLGVDDYDRLYVPGGPAVLADSSGEFAHANVFRRDLEFLFAAHTFGQAILIFHGAADDGPEQAGCAYYRRAMPDISHADMKRRQIADTAEVLGYIAEALPGLEVQVYRAEVQADSHVRFLDLAAARG